MVRLTNLSNSLDKEQVIEGFKKGLIERDICGVKSKPLLLDKLFDEVLEH